MSPLKDICKSQYITSSTSVHFVSKGCCLLGIAILKTSNAFKKTEHILRKKMPVGGVFCKDMNSIQLPRKF